MSQDFIHTEENGIKYLVHPKGSIFEGIKIRENPELFNKKQQNNKDMQESDDIEEISDEPLDDNFIKNNPFFKTLTAIEDEN